LVREGALEEERVLLPWASMPRQIVRGAAGSPTSEDSSTLLVSKRPPPPLELMDVDDQIGVRGATTTLLTSNTSDPQPELPQLL
jgi:hypothetical protein